MFAWLLLATTLGARLPFAGQMVLTRGADEVTLELAGAKESLRPDASEEALVQAWMRLVDARTGWSEEEDWRRLNRWTSPVFGEPRPQNVSARAFASAVGALSPRDDLASFAAAALSDGTVACRLRSQWRFLRQRLGELPPDARPELLPDEPRCRDFDRWSARDRLEAVELVLAAPSTASMGSLFGHLMLRLVYRGEGGPMLDDRFVTFLANNDLPTEADPLYALKGLTGVYRATLAERGLGQVLQEYVVQEGRDLRRYRLHLRPHELDRLMDRLWTARHAYEQRYYFLQDNCATMLVELLRDVLDDDATFTFPRLFGAGPTGALDGLSFVTRADGTPLVAPIHESWTSLHREAVDAARTRAEAERALLASHPELSFDGARSSSSEVRAETIRQLSVALREVDSEEVDRWFAAQATIELHLSRVANAEKEKRLNTERFHRLVDEARTRCDRLAKAHPELAPAVKDFWSGDRSVRHEAFAAFARALPDAAPELDVELRRCAALHLIRMYGDRLETRPEVREPLFFLDPSRLLEEQDWATPVAELLAYVRVTKLTPGLLACQEARAARRHLAPPPWRRFREEEKARRADEAREHWDRAWPHTGIDGTTVGLDLSSGGLGVRLGGAIYDERLGDRRRNGFPGHTAFTFLKTETTIGTRALLETKARLVGWRSLAPSLREEEGLFAPFGWEGFLDVEASRPRGWLVRPRLGASVLLPVLASRDLSSHLLLRAGGDWSLAVDGEVNFAHGVAGLAGAEARWTPSRLGGRHFLEATSEWRTGFDFVSGKVWHEWLSRAAISFGVAPDVKLPLAGHTGVRVVVGARYERATGPFLPLTRPVAELLVVLD